MSKKNKRTIRAAATPISRGADFNPDYSQVRQDLKRIGILAGSFFAILVILAIFQDKIFALFTK